MEKVYETPEDLFEEFGIEFEDVTDHIAELAKGLKFNANNKSTRTY